MEGHPVWMPFLILHEFHLVGDDVMIGDLLASAFPAFPDTDSSKDVDVSTNFQKVQIGDVFTFPRSDIMPGSFDDRRTVLRSVVAFSHDVQTDGPGSSVVLDVGTPYFPLEFNFV